MPRSRLNRDDFSRQHVLDARDNWINHPGWDGFGQSKHYDVIIEGVRYPPMPIIAFATIAAGNEPIGKHFGGSIKGWGHQTLKKAGYQVVPKTALGSEDKPADPDKELEDDLSKIMETEASPTERKQLIQARIGQGEFRRRLLEYWDGECAVLGIARPELLRASHIRRWADCVGPNEYLRTEPQNGLLLSANLDCLFENGLIAFDDKGKLLKHDALQKEVAKAVGIDKPARLRRKPTETQAMQLAHHRERFGY